MDGLDGISPIPGSPPPETTPQIGREDRVEAVRMEALQGNEQVTGAGEVVLTEVPPVAERVDILRNQLLRSSADEESIPVAASPGISPGRRKSCRWPMPIQRSFPAMAHWPAKPICRLLMTCWSTHWHA